MVNGLSKSGPVVEALDVVIEIGGGFVKYEFDDEGRLCVDRFLNVSMSYPCAYGYVENTLADDGDPLDVLVLTRCPILPGSHLTVRPVGVLLMSDEEGNDPKILAVPTSKVDPFYATYREFTDVPKETLESISHFFEHYKDREISKMAKVEGWQDVAYACALIHASFEKFHNHQ